MEYFSLLHLKKEPFSNSPDPELFFHSHQHKSCLQKLELAIRLKRGLSVVLGDIGTGKSTLSRQLVRIFAKDIAKIDAKLILDPAFTSPHEFLQTILKTFSINNFDGSSEWQMKEAIKNHLFEQGVDLQTVSVLIIDEGQKLPGFCLEILREFLNYETNQHKLLQIIIFAQEEFKDSLKEKANFADRITTLQHLKPLSLKETKQMIRFRISQTRDDSAPSGDIFSSMAFLGIYMITKGYPRKIIMLCHKIILNLLVTNKKRASLSMVLSAAKETSFSHTRGKMILTVCTLSCIGALLIFFFNGLPAEKQLTLIQPTPVSSPTPLASVHPRTIPSAIRASETIPQSDKLASVKILNNEETLPAMLGQLTVEEGLSLGYMISSVYGKFTTKRASAVMAANPKISDPDRIQFGTKINFPRLSTNQGSSSGKFCIELGKATTLQEGYDYIRNSKELSHDLMLRPLLNNEEKNHFQIILKKHYTYIKWARSALEQLPEEYEARIEKL